MMSVMMGHSVGRQAFSKVVGMGSREQVEALALVTKSVVTEASTGAKQAKGGHATRGAMS